MLENLFLGHPFDPIVSYGAHRGSVLMTDSVAKHRIGPTGGSHIHESARRPASAFADDHQPDAPDQVVDVQSAGGLDAAGPPRDVRVAHEPRAGSDEQPRTQEPEQHPERDRPPAGHVRRRRRRRRQGRHAVAIVARAATGVITIGIHLGRRVLSARDRGLALKWPIARPLLKRRPPLWVTRPSPPRSSQNKQRMGLA